MENVDDDTNADDNGDADGNGDADDDPVVAPVDGWHFIDPPGCPGRSKDGRVAKPSKTQDEKQETRTDEVMFLRISLLPKPTKNLYKP